MKSIKLIIFGALALFIASCNSNGSDDALTPAQQIAKTWGVSLVIIDGQLDISTDYSAYQFTFNADGTYTFNDPNPRSGSWRFINSSNGRTEQSVSALELDGDQVYPIIFLSPTQFVFERMVPATFKTPEGTARFELSPM